jgi:hypothetical protein
MVEVAEEVDIFTISKLNIEPEISPIGDSVSLELFF